MQLTFETTRIHRYKGMRGSNNWYWCFMTLWKFELETSRNCRSDVYVGSPLLSDGPPLLLLTRASMFYLHALLDPPIYLPQMYHSAVPTCYIASGTALELIFLLPFSLYQKQNSNSVFFSVSWYIGIIGNLQLRIRFIFYSSNIDNTMHFIVRSEYRLTRSVYFK